MFARESKVAVQATGSPSLLPNNLSSSHQDSMVYTRSNDAILVKANGDLVRLPIARCKIFQTSFVEVMKLAMIVVLSDLGVQAWSADGDTMIFYYALSSLLGNQLEDTRFTRGITCVQQYMCVGCSTGHALVFDCSAGITGANFPLVHCLEASKEPISCLSSSNDFLVAANDFGTIFIHRAASAFELAHTFKGSGVPITSIVNSDFVIAAGFATGQIRIFRLDVLELAVEITAHTRMVSALAWNDKLSLLASCSPDQYLHVWNMPSFRSKATSNVDNVYSDLLEYRVNTGVTFLGDKKLCVASYDEDDLMVYQLV